MEFPPYYYTGGPKQPRSTLDMNIVYKYLKIFDPDYFIDPTMKISLPEHFNDPFESTTGTITDDTIRLYLKEIYMMNESQMEAYYDITRRYIDYKISTNGVISLTRKNEDILMWSHYADNHKGMCIGLEDDFAIHKSDTKLHLTETLLPTPVSYNKHRIDLNKKISIDKFPDDLYRAHIFNKYEQWEYEKEHRVLIPIQLADKIKIDKSDIIRKIKFIDKKEYQHSMSEWLPTILEDKQLEELNENGKTYYKRHSDVELSLQSPLEIYLGKFEETTFLINIPRNKIKEIYFGHKTPEATIKHMYQQLKNPENKLTHVNIFKFSLSQNEFKLTPTYIDDKYIETLSI